MEISSIIAIYALFWVMSAFLLLPFRLHTSKGDTAVMVPGQADSAPASFRPAKWLICTTILSALLCALFVANYVNGWILFSDLNFFGEPPGWQDGAPAESQS